MKTIRNLYKTEKGRTCYIVGTGPSLRVFPVKFFDNKYTIGLNQAYKYFDPTLSITIHPYLIPYDKSKWNCKWATKVKPTCEGWREHLKRSNKQYLTLFENNDNASDFTYFRDTKSFKLFVGRGIHTGAIHLACLMGFKYIVLVGCDFCELTGEHHGHNQHIEFHGYCPEAVYKEYYYYTVKCRELARKIFGAEVISMSSMVGSNYANQDFDKLKKERGLEPLEKPTEIEKVKREYPLISSYL